MLDQIEAIKSKINLFLAVILMSSCANSDPTNMPLDQRHCNLINEAINLDRLQQYYHIDTFPDRIPLIVVIGKKGVNCKDLVKFGKPVKVVGRINTSSQDDEVYLELTKIDVTNNAALVNFKYAPEGIRGEIKFKKLNSRWTIFDSTIVEL